MDRDLVHETDEQWNPALPRTLVIACSDGRFQEELDRVLERQLGVTHYDRLYIPGGAGALAPSGIQFTRAQQFRSECRFLIAAHGIRELVLLFHGPSPDGPPEALCGDYVRKLPGRSPAEIRKQQDTDARELLRAGFGSGVRVAVYRCEVTAAGRTRFVRLEPAQG